jgi:tetratricopeptide (TPR) repeat protein
MGRILEVSAGVVFSAIGVAFACWLLWKALKKSDDPARIFFKILFSAALVIGETLFVGSMIGGLHNSTALADNAPNAFVIAGSIAGCGIILSIVWTPQISNFFISPLTDMFDGGSTPPEPKPFYSIAISKRKRNKPVEAAIRVREQLKNFPNDFEGVMLLAGIQAEDLNDLPSAEETLNQFCSSENAPPKQFAAAQTQLADWYMKFHQDAGAARIALQRIIERYPDTEMEVVARQRIAHLGGTKKTLLAAQDRQPVYVPEGIQNMGLLDSSKHVAPVETSPAELAAGYVKQLAEHPGDTEAREKLAVIYATHYKRLDLATNELEQLIAESNHHYKRTAHWLNLLADLQVRGGADFDTARATLERIVDLFPDHGVAEVARTRLAHLKLEFKALEQTENKTLGTYEQNIGLKSNRTY